MNRRSASPLGNISGTTNTPGLDPMAGDIMDGFVGHDETDYISSERLPVMDFDAAHQSLSHPRHIELGDDDDAPERYAEDYNPLHVARILRKSQTAFEIMKDEGLGETPWSPFSDEDEWELAQFLIKEVSQTAADKFLKLRIVSRGLFRTHGQIAAKLTEPSMCQTKERTQLSYSSSYKLLKKIDSLAVRLEWKCEVIKVTGNVIGADGKPEVENVELWCRDPIQSVQELIGNPMFREHLSYTPQKVFTTESGTTRIYDEAWTGDWWWTMQVRIRVLSIVQNLIKCY